MYWLILTFSSFSVCVQAILKSQKKLKTQNLNTILKIKIEFLLFSLEYLWLALKRFSSDIENKLNKLFYMGYVEFERWEILCWFGVEKITKSVWAGLLNNGHLGLMMVIARLLILFAVTELLLLKNTF